MSQIKEQIFEKVKEYFDSPSDQYYTAKDLIKLKIADHIL